MTIVASGNVLPRMGDLAWVNLDPRIGREQSGNRPVVILSPYGYHEKTNYMVICPITSNVTPYPFKLILPDDVPVSGAVLVDQVKSVDRLARGCGIFGHMPETVMADIRGLLATLLQIPMADAASPQG